MTQRTALFASAALTAFVIIAVAAVLLAYPSLDTALASDSDNVAAAEMAAQTETLVLPSPTPAETQLLETLQARDAAYRSQIEQANGQLQQAYDEISQLKTQNQELLQRDQAYRMQLESVGQFLQALQVQSMQAQSQPSSADQAFWQGDDDHQENDHEEAEHSESHDDD
ncbi:MAG: hypothetical protein J5I90_09860 [Caldilineales bacterium]|nr:hypothetical protein [Caldilineales bacterium]